MGQRRSPSPCKDCHNRVLGCHGSCDRYEAFRHSIDDANEELNASRAGDSEFFAYRHDRRAQRWIQARSNHNKRFGKEKKDNNV